VGGLDEDHSHSPIAKRADRSH
jgi:hypothetical protein